MTLKLFDRDSIEYTYINVEHDENAYEYVTKTLGYKQAPTVVALYPDGSETNWSGFQPARIKGYVTAAKGWRDDS